MTQKITKILSIKVHYESKEVRLEKIRLGNWDGVSLMLIIFLKNITTKEINWREENKKGRRKKNTLPRRTRQREILEKLRCLFKDINTTICLIFILYPAKVPLKPIWSLKLITSVVQTVGQSTHRSYAISKKTLKNNLLGQIINNKKINYVFVCVYVHVWI